MIPNIPSIEERQFLAIVFIAQFTWALSGCAAPQAKVPAVESVAAEIEAKKQRELVVESYVNKQTRLYRVAHRILTKGVVLCGENRTHAVGAQVISLELFPDEWKEAARSKLGATDLVQISSVVPDSPAFNAGLREGDILISINDWQVPVGDGATKKLTEQTEEILKSGNPFSVGVRRNGQNVDVTVRPIPACDYQIALENKDEKNAFADGKRIVFYTGLMDFFSSDDEVALVLSHELAHNSMGHVTSKQTNAIIGGVLGAILDIAAAAGGVNTQGGFTRLGAEAGAGAYSVGFEQEADYIGLYFMALADYDIKDAAQFWRRMAIQNPQAIQLRTSHPTTPERFVGIEKAVDEITNKKGQGLPLSPEINQQ